MTWILIVTVILVPVALAVLWKLKDNASRMPDPVIDDLIDQNRYKYIEQMSETNLDRVQEIGQERWDNAVKAKERLS